ncbi:MAG: GyrI-like domain-containing protein [Bauldia sp.]
MNIETTTVTSAPMLYVTRTTPMAPEAIAAAMQDAFTSIGTFVGQNAVEVTGPPIAVYRDYGAETVTMDVGFPVTKASLGKAGNGVRSGTTPGGKALMAVHVGPYDRLRETYAAIGDELNRRGITMPATSWERYVGDPAATPPEELRTEIYLPLR